MSKPAANRPRKPFDWDQFNKLCALPIGPVTNQDIASIMCVSEDTCSRRIKEEFQCTFAEYRKQKEGKFKASLLSKQIQVALSGNVSMLIWLGKNYLHQTDKKEIAHDVAKDAGKLIVDLSGDKDDHKGNGSNNGNGNPN